MDFEYTTTFRVFSDDEKRLLQLMREGATPTEAIEAWQLSLDTIDSYQVDLIFDKLVNYLREKRSEL